MKNPAALGACEVLQSQEEVFWPTEVLLAGKISKVIHENRMRGVGKNKYFVISNLGAAVIVFLTISSPPFKILLRAPVQFRYCTQASKCAG